MGSDEARTRLPELLSAASRGQATVVTRRGRPVAAVVSVEVLEAHERRGSLRELAGSGQGLWGADPAQAIAAMRDEW